MARRGSRPGIPGLAHPGQRGLLARIPTSRRGLAPWPARALRRTRVPWVALALHLALVAQLGGSLVGCGGGSAGSDSDQEPTQPLVLFEGSARELLPHADGSVARFRSTASTTGEALTSTSTATVSGSSAEGEFATEHLLEDGRRARIEARDAGDEIAIERVVTDPGSDAEESVALDPPAILVRTPVIAQQRLRTSFVRTVDIAVTAEGSTVVRPVRFVGHAERTPIEVASVEVPAGSFAGAVRYALTATGSAAIEVLGLPVELTVEVEGEEWLAPGVGLVRESLDLVVRSAGSSASGRIVSERLATP